VKSSAPSSARRACSCARDRDGFDERLLARVEALAGVKQAAALLERTATLLGVGGRHVTVSLAGAEVSLATLDGLGQTLPIDALSPGGIGLSRLTARELGILGVRAPGGGQCVVTLKLRGAVSQLKVAAVLGPEAAGALSRALVAVVQLRTMQRLAGLPGRITRILVQAQPGREAAVRGELQGLAGDRLTLAPAYQDVTQLRQALRPSDQASELFAVIGALLGFLFAFNAMLLTVPERRRAVADLRLAGTRRAAIVQMVLFQALCLGVLASLVGLLAGYALSVWVFHQSTGYLAEAFTLSSSTVVGAGPVLVSFIGEVLVTCLASAVPLLDLRGARARDAVYHDGGVPGNALGSGSGRRLLAGAVVLAGALFASVPSAAIFASAALALATVLALLSVFALVLRAVGLLCERYRGLTTLPIALASMRATTPRSFALAATGAVALFGSVALGGARENLLRGIGSSAHSYVSDASIWVSEPGDNQAVNDFSPGETAARIARVPGVAAVHSFQGGFLTLGNRRVWVIARPPGTNAKVLASQIVDGSPASAIRQLSEGGSIAVSKQIADERHLGVGGFLTIPTPTGNAGFRIAATTTNLAWSPGVIFMGAADFGRAWASTSPTALGVDLAPGTDLTGATRAIGRALGPASGLEVSPARSREARINALAGEGLSQLGEISVLLVLAAILAMAAALGSSVYQRRASLAGLRLSGASPRRLRRALLAEAALMLGAGCVTGAIAGLFGQFIIDGYLRHVTGFPVASAAASARPLEVLVLVLGAALVIVAIPGWLASRVPPALALREE
jgi:putative ABC transport system permease protein